MLDKSVNDFLRKLSSKEPVPGGGSVAALLGSMCCALGDMVCNLTIGKVKYSEYDYINQQIRSKLYDLQNEFNDLCYQDIEVFNRLVNTYKLPGITSEEIEYKEKVMTPLIYDAISVPISVMKKSVESLQYIDELKNHSSKLAISDIGVAVSCAKSCLESAAMNVYINTSMLSDKNRSKEINNEANELLHKGISSEEYIVWKKTMERIEQSYFDLIELGAKPEEARSVLPNSLKTEIVVTMNLREWRHFLSLRTSPKAHPQIREITIPLLNELKEKMPVVFDDINCI